MIMKILSYISKSVGFLLVGFAVLMVVSAYLVHAMADNSGQLRDNIGSSIEDFLGSTDAEEFIKSTQLYNDLSKFNSRQLAMACDQQPELCEGVSTESMSAMEISRARLRDNLADTQASGIETILSQIKSYEQYKPMMLSLGIVLLIIGMVFVFLATFNVLELFSSTLKYIAVNLFLMAIGFLVMPALTRFVINARAGLSGHSAGITNALVGAVIGWISSITSYFMVVLFVLAFVSAFFAWLIKYIKKKETAISS
jgi:hypothetical protein